MKILVISKDNLWTRKLVHLLYEEEYDCTYTSICSKELIDDINPDWVFFFHWSNIVPKEIHKKHKCVVLHVGNLPKGRGGSPIQNQILEGITNTKVNAIKMEESVDGGGVYHSIPISLQGNITDIWFSLAETSYKLINYCVNNNPTPIPQKGTPQTYKRIKNNQLKFDFTKDLSHLYDQIRMVDNALYPNPYMDIDGFRLEFSRAKLENNELTADVKIKIKY